MAEVQILFSHPLLHWFYEVYMGRRRKIFLLSVLQNSCSLRLVDTCITCSLILSKIFCILTSSSNSCKCNNHHIACEKNALENIPEFRKFKTWEVKRVIPSYTNFWISATSVSLQELPICNVLTPRHMLVNAKEDIPLSLKDMLSHVSTEWEHADSLSALL